MNDKKHFATESTELTEYYHWSSLWERRRPRRLDMVLADEDVGAPIFWLRLARLRGCK
jgi:hypothetical protein